MVAVAAIIALSVLAFASSQATATGGCGKQHDFVGKSREFSFDSNGIQRTYRIHLPSSYGSNTPRPLLIAFHGSGNNPAKFEGQCRFSDDDVNPDMVVVYPAGVDHNWEGASYATPGIDDKAFTSDLVSRIQSLYCINERRIYASGHSNGAGFANTLACSPQHGGVFAAFAPISGAFYTDATAADAAQCRLARSPLPMLEVHGTADKTIPYGGGEGRGGALPDIGVWVQRWARRDGCEGKPSTTHPSGRVTDSQWRCGGVDGVVRHIRIEGMGHGWPKLEADTIDISPLVIEYLSAFERPGFF